MMPRWRHVAPQSNATSTPCSARGARTMMLWLRSGSIPRPRRAMRRARRRGLRRSAGAAGNAGPHAPAPRYLSCRRCRASATPSCRSSCARRRATGLRGGAAADIRAAACPARNDQRAKRLSRTAGGHGPILPRLAQLMVRAPGRDYLTPHQILL
jgi:hypothetical protein